MSQHINRQSGFSASIVIAAIVTVLVVAGTGYVVFKQSGTSKGETASSTAATPTPPTPTPPNAIAPPATEPVKTYEGKLYNNVKYGLSFNYPDKWRIEERDPATTSLEPEKTALSLWLLDSGAEKYPEAAVVTIKLQDLQTVVAGIEAEVGSHGQRTSQTLNGKQAVKFTIPQGGGVNRVWYLFGVESKTYWVQTIKEEENLARNAKYMSDFNIIVNSLKLP